MRRFSLNATKSWGGAVSSDLGVLVLLALILVVFHVLTNGQL